MLAMNRARDIVQEVRQDAITSRSRIEEFHVKKIRDADEMRKEASRNRKLIKKHEKHYLRRAQEKIFEMQVSSEAFKIRNQKYMASKLENYKREKDQAFLDESRLAMKRNSENKKLEHLEVEAVKRLMETQDRQQQAITEIQDIFNSQNPAQYQYQIFCKKKEPSPKSKKKPKKASTSSKKKQIRPREEKQQVVEKLDEFDLKSPELEQSKPEPEKDESSTVIESR